MLSTSHAQGKMERPPHSSPDPPEAGAQNDPGVDDEYRLLTSEQGRRLLEDVAALRTIGPSELDRLRKRAPAGMVSAAVRLTMARRKAAGKFERGGRMWVEPVGVEQATAEPVARHKAIRFRTSPIVVDLCAGIGGDAIALAASSRVVAVDMDPGMCRRLRWNAAVYEVADSVLAVRARAESFPIPVGARIHLDPDRRASGDRRARALDDYAPGPAAWADLIDRVPGGAIKLSPAADFARLFPSGSGCEIELISLRGECKEATVWFGELAECRRRATRLPGSETWTDRDGIDPEPPGLSPLSNWIFDPDPSLIRAGLLEGFARFHRLSRIADGVDYLTGPDPVDTSFLSAFAVREVSSLDLKHLRRMIQRHDVGILEIKVRGLDVSPESLRAQLKPRGSESSTLLIVGGPAPARAVLARRVGK
jgi:THUMP domain-like/RNA cap guanine-N2 methyltransferase